MNQLVWYRNDLRLSDQPTLHSAIEKANKNQTKVIACYIDCSAQWQLQDMAPIKHNLINARVNQLHQELEAINITLLIRSVDLYDDVANCLQEICKTHHIGDVYLNQEHMIYEDKRDHEVKSLLSEIDFHEFSSDTIIEPNTLRTLQNKPYQVFGYFKRAWLKQLPPLDALPKPTSLSQYNRVLDNNSLQKFTVEFNLDEYPVKESKVLDRLRTFVREQVQFYRRDRDFPSLCNTSKLSAYLAIGLLSPKQCILRLMFKHPDIFIENELGANTWLSELIWREFYRSTMVSFPRVIKGKAFQKQFQFVEYRNERSLFDAWCNGMTGFPIVDAAMRQLNQTGWMHNRLRMVTASFLVKDLHIDWRWGEKYFMKHLIDGDLAANNGGWQWAASTGTDAAPYFRIFNPTTQGERFDKDGVFVKRFVPELKDVPTKYIHNPHNYSTKYEVTLRYPKMIVDHKVARIEAIEMYEKAKTSYIT